MLIQAAVVRERSAVFTIEDLELEEPRDDEVLVRIVAVGMCHTDLATRHGQVPRPVVLGHEGAGIVERVGNQVTKASPGDHVVLAFDSCGACFTCQRGMPAYCENDLACNLRPRAATAPAASAGAAKSSTATSSASRHSRRTRSPRCGAWSRSGRTSPLRCSRRWAVGCRRGPALS
jgi:aryl-alcohol dehydrogenase